MKNGFTLIELLIVIAIMGILTTITVGQFITAKKKANDVARKSDLNGVSKALQMYFADYGVMPDMSDSLGGQIMLGSTVIDWGSDFIDGSYVYMKPLPRENSYPKLPAYCYKTDLSKKKYALFAQLENITDKECTPIVSGIINKYKCGIDQSIDYCFAYVSPNTSLKPNGDLL